MGRTGSKHKVHQQRAELLVRQELFLLVRKGRSSLRRGELREAEQLFLKALAIEPLLRAALSGLGEVFLQRKDFATAADYLERALHAGEHTEFLLYALANACRGALRRDKAFKYYQQLVELNPSHVRGLTRLGEACLERKDFERASELFTQALALETHNAFALRGLGAALRGKRRYGEAIAAYERLLRLDPDDYRALLRLAEAYGREGDRESASRAYRLVLQIDPDNHYAVAGLATLADR